MMIKDPWGRLHRVNDLYDKDDLIVTPPTAVTFTLMPDDQLTREAYNFNRSSTMETINKPVTLVDLVPVEKVARVKNNW